MTNQQDLGYYIIEEKIFNKEQIVMEKIFENFTITVLKLNKLVNKIKTYEMKEYGLKAIHVMCIYYLGEHPEGLKAADLVKLTLEDKAAISRGLALLRTGGYVTYNPDKYNADIRLTEEGKALAAGIAEKSERAVSAGNVPFTDGERENFYRSLHVIAENLNAYYEQLTGAKR